MTTQDEERIRLFSEELDRLVPRTGASVRLEQYGGGPDEGRFVANQAGYFRFGIELLKAGIIPHQPAKSGPSRLAVDLSYLISDDSVIGFDEFMRDESLPLSRTSENSAANMVGAVLGGLFIIGCIAVVVFSVIGVIAVIRWL